MLTLKTSSIFPCIAYSMKFIVAFRCDESWTTPKKNSWGRQKAPPNPQDLSTSYGILNIFNSFFLSSCHHWM